jgi:hypothetical protein
MGLLWALHVALVWCQRLIIAGVVWALLLAVLVRPALAYDLGGVERNPAEWYYCYDYKVDVDGYSYTGVNWAGLTCTQLLWVADPGGGGGYQSLMMEFGVAPDPSPTGAAATLRAFVVPAQYIDRYDWSCDGFVTRCRDGLGSEAGQVSASRPAYYTGSQFSGSGSSVDNSCTTSVYDWAGYFDQSTVGRFFAHDPVDGDSVEPPYFETKVSMTNENRWATAGLSCQITDWTMEAGQDEWIPVLPTPTPGPGGGTPWPTVPAWTWPATHTVAVGVTPQPTSCAAMMVGYTNTVDTGFFSTTFGFPGVEVCTQPQSLELEFLGWDFGAWLMTFGLLLGAGVLVSVVKRA